MSYSDKSHRDSEAIYIESLGYDKETKRLILICGHGLDHGIELYINSKTVSPVRTGLNLPYEYANRYDIELASNTNTIEFRSVDTIYPIKFVGQMSKLSNQASHMCWRFCKFLATHNNTSILIRRSSWFTSFIHEILFLISAMPKNPKAMSLRILYWVTKPLFRGNIWLFADKIYRAGDNAEYIYRYARKHSLPHTKYYYILSKDSADSMRFHKQNTPYVRYKSLKQRLLFLNTDILVFTHNNAPGFYRFGGKNSAFFRDLYNYDTMYVQHGLSVQEMSSLYNKSVDDIRRYFVASPFETNNLLDQKYGYLEHEILHTGVARYDGLQNSPKKDLLLAPTWRKEVARQDNDYDEPGTAIRTFKDTPYYEVYNRLITDSTLLSCMRKYGYTLTLLLHPSLSDVAAEFSTNDSFINILSPSDDISYEKLLSEASILITDYSGLQFDFAYMYKPILYYQPNEIEASYDESVYKYSVDALGDISYSHDGLVDKLCLKIKNSCELEQKYKRRIDNFFYFHDGDNSKRIYESISGWQTK